MLAQHKSVSLILIGKPLTYDGTMFLASSLVCCLRRQKSARQRLLLPGVSHPALVIIVVWSQVIKVSVVTVVEILDELLKIQYVNAVNP